MTIGINLMKVILALDVYSRGYDAAIKFGDLPGNNSIDTPGIQIGSATIANNRGQQDAQDIGFYAAAYDYNGQRIISYRGTDGKSAVVEGNISTFSGFVGGTAYLANYVLARLRAATMNIDSLWKEMLETANNQKTCVGAL